MASPPPAAVAAPPESPSPDPLGMEDLGQAFDFEDSEDEEDEDEEDLGLADPGADPDPDPDPGADPGADPGTDVLQAPPRRRRTPSSAELGPETPQG
ncbi:rho guanine nucleotide exchange factor 10-like protein [Malurus melanocephalus]|uniref:rho guanine nucleotide exchange factor 10-like protein n=1 Tax=Malurus melanocephalus TaxID=175006 RepID=UPI0025484781|nr:rho guanine nucleotide exchange factor 10-like protein [Malurus melanocephalus]